MQRVFISNTLLLFLSKFDITPLDSLFQRKCIASDSSIVCICIALSDWDIHFHIFTRHHIECYSPFCFVVSLYHSIQRGLLRGSGVDIVACHIVHSLHSNQVESHQHNHRISLSNKVHQSALVRNIVLRHFKIELVHISSTKIFF